MKALLPAIESFFSDEHGATAIEYGLISALIAIGCIVAFGVFGSGLQNLFGTTDSGAGGAMRDAAASI